MIRRSRCFSPPRYSGGKQVDVLIWLKTWKHVFSTNINIKQLNSDILLLKYYITCNCSLSFCNSRSSLKQIDDSICLATWKHEFSTNFNINQLNSYLLLLKYYITCNSSLSFCNSRSSFKQIDDLICSTTWKHEFSTNININQLNSYLLLFK